MRYELHRHRQFIRDVKRLKKAGWNLGILGDFLEALQKGQPFPARYKIHPLHGELGGIWDAHIVHNWVILFRFVGDSTIELLRTGTHASVGLE